MQAPIASLLQIGDEIEKEQLVGCRLVGWQMAAATAAEVIFVTAAAAEMRSALSLSLYFADQLNKIAFAAAPSLAPERCRPKEWNGMD